MVAVVVENGSSDSKSIIISSNSNGVGKSSISSISSNSGDSKISRLVVVVVVVVTS